MKVVTENGVGHYESVVSTQETGKYVGSCPECPNGNIYMKNGQFYCSDPAGECTFSNNSKILKKWGIEKLSFRQINSLLSGSELKITVLNPLTEKKCVSKVRLLWIEITGQEVISITVPFNGKSITFCNWE